MHNSLRRLSSVCLTWMMSLAWSAVQGQAAQSPFSYAGLGEHYGNALTTNQGMAGLGISQPQSWYLNNINPALLSYNGSTVFEAGLLLESRNVVGDTLSQRNTNGNMNYLAIAFPIRQRNPFRIATSVGIMPYTTVNYKLEYTEEIEGPTAIEGEINEQGTGGLTQLYWASGFSITPDLAAGIRVNYIFGSTDYDYVNHIDLGQSIPYSVAVSEQTYITDFTLGGGLSYSKDSLLNGNYALSLGLVYNHGGHLNARRTSVLERRDNQGFAIDTDTLTTKRGELFLPPSYTAGLSISNRYYWSAGFEFGVQNWSKFRNLDNESGGLNRSWHFAVGGEYTPNPLSFQNYLERVTYRAGLSYEKSLFLANNADVNDFGINFGISFPVKQSSLDFAFRIGKRGNTTANLIEERYFKVYFGITINDRWFIKRRLD